MAIALTDLLPQSPLVGPPLPKGLNILWPWSKAAAFNVGDRVAVNLPGGLSLGTGTIQSIVSAGQYLVQLDSGISDTIPGSLLVAAPSVAAPGAAEAAAAAAEAKAKAEAAAAATAEAKAKAEAAAAEAKAKAAAAEAEAKAKAEAAAAAAAQPAQAVPGAPAIAPATPGYATLTSITGPPIVKRGTSYQVAGVVTNLDVKPHSGRLTAWFGQPGNPKVVNLVIIPERLLTIQPGTFGFTGSVTVPKNWATGVYPFSGIFLDTSVSPFHSSKLQSSVIIT